MCRLREEKKNPFFFFLYTLYKNVVIFSSTHFYSPNESLVQTPTPDRRIVFSGHLLFWTCFWRTWELAEPRHRKRSGTSTWKWFSKAKGGRTDWRLLNVRYGEARHFARAMETLRGLRSNACPIYSRQPVSEGLDASIVRLSLTKPVRVSPRPRKYVSSETKANCQT